MCSHVVLIAGACGMLGILEVWVFADWLSRYWLLTSFGFSPFQDDLELLFSVYAAWYPQSPAASQISLQNKATENEQKTTFRPNYPLPSLFSRCMKDLINRLLMLCQNAVLTTAFLLFSFSVCRTIRTIMWFVVLNCPILKTFKVSFDLAIESTWATFELGILSCDLLINLLIGQYFLFLSKWKSARQSSHFPFSYIEWIFNNVIKSLTLIRKLQ